MKKTVIAIGIVLILLIGISRCFRVETSPSSSSGTPEKNHRPGLAKLLFGRKGPPRKGGGSKATGYSYDFPRQAAVTAELLKRSLEVIKEAEESRNFQEAEQLRRDGDYRQAMEQYDRALSQRPENGYIKQRKKLAQLKLHQEQALENGYVKRAFEHYENGRMQSAEETARLALEQADNNRYIKQMAYNILAGCYHRSDRKKAAMHEVISREILEDIDNDLGQAYFYLDRTD